MTRRYFGAVPTVEEIHALINMIGGQYVLLDTHVADLLKLHVATLNDRVWRELAPSCDEVPSEWYVLELNSGHNNVAFAYTLLGISAAIKVSGKRSTARVLAERIAQAFDIKEGECRASGLPYRKRGLP